MSRFVRTSEHPIASLANQLLVDIYIYIYICNTGFVCFGITFNIPYVFTSNTNHLLKYWFQLFSSKSIILTNLSTLFHMSQNYHQHPILGFQFYYISFVSNKTLVQV